MALLFTLFTTHTPAHAAVESVNPSSYRMVLNQCIDATLCTNEIFTYDSAATWCASYFANHPRPGYSANTVTKLLFGGINYNYAPPAYGYSCAIYNQDGYAYGTAALFTMHATCPNPFYGPVYAFNPENRKCERTVPDCPANSTRSNIYPYNCNCHTGYEYDLLGGICRPLRKCPVDALPTFPPENDACAQVLENFSSTQAQKYAACGSLTPAMETGKACLESKLAAMTPAAIPFTMTANIRNIAYQAHFSEVWRKMEEVVDWMGKNPIMQSVCTDRRAEIAAEKGCDNAGPCAAKAATATTPAVPACYPATATRRSHCLTGRPADPDPNTAQHTLGNAIDVDLNSTINPLKATLAGRNPPQTIPQFLAAPTTAYPAGCNLGWGGEFLNNYDPVHFYVP